MNEVILLVSQYIMITLINLFVFLFFKKVYGCKYNKKWIYISGYFITLTILIGVNKLGNPYFNAVYTFTSNWIICMIFFESNIKKIWFHNLLLWSICIFCDMITTLMWSIIGDYTFNNILSNNSFMTTSNFCYVLLIFVSLRLYSNLYQKLNVESIKIKTALFIFFMTFFEVFTVMSYSSQITDRDNGIKMIIIVFGFLFIHLFLVYTLNQVSESYKYKYENNLMQKQNKIQLENFREISRKYEESRKTIHDIKKHLNTLKSLEYADKDRAEEYGSIIEQKVDSLFYEFPCSNQLLSIIMSQKILICRNENIKVSTKIEDIPFDFIEDFDITAIFANLWDNSIEACREYDNNRFIDIVIGKVNGFYVISFENGFNGTISKSGDVLQSTKHNHDGVGLTIIKSSVMKYGGFFSASADENVFKSEIMIPINE
ncbi:MAG: GHKL domain-containing protein [Oscillospiraceae bacterium]|nr:GHKL domain-containing protein [Oscillospiraceae bacterium]